MKTLSDQHKGVWVFSENKELMLELLGKGKELAENLKTELAAILFGNNIKDKVDELFGYGANKVYLVDNPLLGKPLVEPRVSALASLAKQYKPDILLIGSTRKGKELASRTAARLETGCVPDCTYLSIDASKRLLMGRIVYGGNAVATQFCRTKPQVATVPRRTFEKPSYQEGKGEVVKFDVKLEEPKTEVVSVKEIEAVEVKIEEAKTVIAGGRGLEKKEDFAILDELSKILGGQVAYTRPLCEDRKWFTDWVGLSGHYIKPALYIGCGISGVIQHVAGIRDSQIIVAINKDPEAPIFEIADYKIIGDLYEILPALSEAIKKQLKTT